MGTTNETLLIGEVGDLLLELEESYLASRVQSRDLRDLQGNTPKTEIDLFYPSILEKIQVIIFELGVDGFLKKYVTKNGDILVEGDTHTLILVPDLYTEVVISSTSDSDSKYNMTLDLYLLKLKTVLENIHGKFNMSTSHGRYLEVQKSIQTGYATIIKQRH